MSILFYCIDSIVILNMAGDKKSSVEKMETDSLIESVASTSPNLEGPRITNTRGANGGVNKKTP